MHLEDDRQLVSCFSRCQVTCQMSASNTCSTVAGSTSWSLDAFSYSSSLLLPPAPSSGSETGLPPPPPPPPILPPPPVKPLEQTACRLRLLSPGPEQQLPTLPAPQGSSTRPETTAEFALPSHCTTGAPAAPGLRGGRPGASARLDPPLLSGRMRRGLVCPRRRRSPGSGPGASCEGNIMRVRLRAASSVRFIRMITATGCGGRFLLREDCHRWLASGDLCCYELHTEHKRPVLLVYEQIVRCIYDYTCPNIIRGVNTVVTDRLYSFGFEVFLS